MIPSFKRSYIKEVQFDNWEKEAYGLDPGPTDTNKDKKEVCYFALKNEENTDINKALEEIFEKQQKDPTRRYCLCRDHGDHRPLYMDTISSVEEGKELLEKYDEYENEIDNNMDETAPMVKALNQTMRKPSGKGFDNLDKILQVQKILQDKDMSRFLDIALEPIMRPLIKASHNVDRPKEQNSAQQILHVMDESCTGGKACHTASEELYGEGLTGESLRTRIDAHCGAFQTLDDKRSETTKKIRERTEHPPIQEVEHTHMHDATKNMRPESHGLDPDARFFVANSKDNWEDAFKEAQALQEKYPHERVCLCERDGTRPLYMDKVKSIDDAKELLETYDQLHEKATHTFGNVELERFTSALNEYMSDPAAGNTQDLNNVISIQQAILRHDEDLDAYTGAIMRPLIESEQSYDLNEQRHTAQMYDLISKTCTDGRAFVASWRQYEKDEDKFLRGHDFDSVFYDNESHHYQHVQETKKVINARFQDPSSSQPELINCEDTYSNNTEDGNAFGDD